MVRPSTNTVAFFRSCPFVLPLVIIPSSRLFAFVLDSAKAQPNTKPGTQHACLKCGMVFKHKWPLQCHKQTAHREMYYLCSLCDSWYCTGSALKLHENQHHPGAPHSSNKAIMPYLFTNSSDESGGPSSARDVHEAKPRDDDWNKLKWKEEDMLLGTKSGGHVEVEDADE
ncbi:hypothetical protein BKA93DRAFT_192297 [Sparassis latifolia]